MSIDNYSTHKLLEMYQEARESLQVLGKSTLFVAKQTQDERLLPVVEVLSMSILSLDRMSELLISLLPKETQQIVAQSLANQINNIDKQLVQDSENQNFELKDTKASHLKLVIFKNE